jgi:GxxExxY protein
MPEIKYKDITEKIIGASFEVHKFLGNGFQEVIYQRALAYELTQAGLDIAQEKAKAVKSINPCQSVIQMSYDIVKAHGGEFMVESKEGEETEFIIQLPA